MSQMIKLASKIGITFKLVLAKQPKMRTIVVYLFACFIVCFFFITVNRDYARRSLTGSASNVK